MSSIRGSQNNNAAGTLRRGTMDGTDTDQKTTLSPPSISLPKGGGAIRGIGEKFSANPVTGTGSLTVPIFTSPGRSGFGPQLSLSYDSGSGNGPFGFGWSLSLPSITRKTDKGLPKYQDDNESDAFILSGSEDLVPVFKKDLNGNWMRDSDGEYIIDECERDGYLVRQYRPRIEGLFARIERWTHKIDGDIHWRSISKDNILTVYGRNERSRIADPKDETQRIFSWLICESYDDKGNAILYEYVAENDKGVNLSQANERNRIRTANRYIKRIRYGNRQPLLLDIKKPSFRKSHIDQTDFSSAEWMFEVVFDYGGEGHYIMLPLDSTQPEDEQHQFVQASSSTSSYVDCNRSTWFVRPDPFSNYRAGFEIRTYRRCQRVLMFHHFPELGSEPCLVRSTEFDYSDFDYSNQKQEVTVVVEVKAELERQGSTRFASFIRTITQSGYLQDEVKPDHILNNVKCPSYIKKSLPPLEFEYSKAAIQEEINEIDIESIENLPYGVDGVNYQFVDLDGEGIPGIFTEQARAWYFKSNLGEGKFSSLQRVETKPSLADLSGGRQQFLDLAGDGNLDVVQLYSSGVSGFYERRYDDKGWETFTPFASLPNISWNDPNLRFIDLTGDGLTDILITKDDRVFTWYLSLAEKGFGIIAQGVHQEIDEEKGPHVVFADATQSIYLADMSGDGLTDLVRIRNGEVCYWPNLGYGRFGTKVTMDNAPWFDTPDQFDQGRIRLADVDGSGVTDIIYLSGRNGVQIYFNQSGNRWSYAHTFTKFPHIDNLSSVLTVDLFGNGTICLIWSSPLTSDSRRPMYYIDLIGEHKPHLLVSSKNNLGAETQVHYVASTKFYLADKAAGKPWITRLPFPVYVVERVTVHDRISRNCFVTRYAYHHGYFDGIEREFRGFGMIEQWDTEETNSIDVVDTSCAVLTQSNISDDARNLDGIYSISPVLTRTWFHTGAYFEDYDMNSAQCDKEYFHPMNHIPIEKGFDIDNLSNIPLQDSEFPHTTQVFDDDLDVEEKHQAYRALKGSIIRQEIYSLDSQPDGTLSEESDRPYTVSERKYAIKRLQARGSNKHAVFLVHPRETIDFHYERKLFRIPGSSPGHSLKLADPRVTHTIVFKVDDYGNVLKSALIGYGRRLPDPNLSSEDSAKQTRTLISYTENCYTNSISHSDNAYRIPLPCETQTFEVVNFESLLERLGTARLFHFDIVQQLVDMADFSKGNWDIPYHDVRHTRATGNHPYRRLIENIRTFYRSNQLDRLLPPGQIDSLALPGRTYKLAFTQDLIEDAYQREYNGMPPEKLLSNPASVLGSENSDGGGYVDIDRDGNWWIPSGQAFYWPNNTNDPAQELNFASKHFFLPHRFSDLFGKNTIVAYDSNEIDPPRNHNLMLTKMIDPLGNTILAHNNYRVLQHVLVSDPNQAFSEVLYDALGLILATAVYKEAPCDSLDNVQKHLTEKQLDDFFSHPRDRAIIHLDAATTFTVYDIARYHRTGNPDMPPYSATLAREMHVSDTMSMGIPPKIQVSFSYSDGFGREIQKKIQAEPGSVNGEYTDSRWVGSGWTIFNKKGNPVRKYEPFFDNNHTFRFDMAVGVSSIVFYDALQRIIVTLHPNNTYEKVVFDPWHQKIYDVNDTVTLDPRVDEDVIAYMSKYFAVQSENWHTWYQQRISGTLGVEEQKVAKKTEAHANTPTVDYFDTLGRVVLRVTHNGRDLNSIDVLYKTRITLDMEGNQREIIDTEGRIAMQSDYNMLGISIKQTSMDAGTRWILNNVSGNTIRAWDNRGFNRRMTYDALQRPLEVFITDNSGSSSVRTELLAYKTTYGELKPNPEDTNHRMRIWEVRDGGGILINERYDFKGNLVLSKRLLASDYKDGLDWAQAPTPPLEDEVFSSHTLYDALNRPIQIIPPHCVGGAKINVIQTVYNEANLTERIDAWLEQATEPSKLLDPDTATNHFITNINYNARGQRDYIEYGMENGNHVWTTYEYDDKTFNLVRVQTKRIRNGNTNAEFLQDICYTYDPMGNITHIHDRAQQDKFIKGRWVNPETDYCYDAVYRLKEAIGREVLGLSNNSTNPPEPVNRTDDNRVGFNDPYSLGSYDETYFYDSVGNILKVNHVGTDPSDPGWVRSYNYNEDSKIELGKKNNRLSSTIVRGTTYSYRHDAHGNMIMMPHLTHNEGSESTNMNWDFRDQLQRVDLGGGGRVYLIYDSRGQRLRKVHEHNGALTEERIYLGNFEVYRKRSGAASTIVLERQTLHIVNDKQRVALVESRTQGNDGSSKQLIRYQLTNHLGSACLELDHRARIISYEEYYPYGGTSYHAVRSRTEAYKRYRYTGKERDEETGFYYYGTRYYATWLGRWTSCDPAGLVDDVNLYVYVSANPIGKLDEQGLFKIDWRAVGRGALYAAAGVAVAAVAVAAVAATGGVAAAAAATYLGATATTAATVQTVTAGAVYVTASAYGGYQTGKALHETFSGNDYETGQELTDTEHSEVIGESAVMVGALAFGGRRALRARAEARAQQVSDQNMIETLIETRRGIPADSNRGARTRANKTFSIGRESSGGLTPIRESVPKGGSHAEPQTVGDLASSGNKQTIAVDQVPCTVCDPMLEANLPAGSRVLVPREVGSSRPLRSIDPNYKSGVKGTSEAAARNEVKVISFEIIRTPKAWIDTLEFAPVRYPYEDEPPQISIDPSMPTPAEAEAQQSLPEPYRYY